VCDIISVTEIMRAAVLFSLALLAALPTVPAATRDASDSPASRVAVFETPDQGIQPQAAVDGRGAIHLVYFKGEPSGGDVYYIKLMSGTTGIRRITDGVRVNSVAGSALATGTVRGAQLALGRNGIVHVAWHGSKAVERSGSPHPPVWYTRSADGARFEPQRILSGPISGIDGSTVAADRNGRVTVAWHGMGARPGEGDRTVYVANSTNDGASFASPSPATTAPLGACGCCGLKAMFDRTGTLNLLYRAATGGKHRDTIWLAIRNGVPSVPVRVHPWELDACPMSTYALADAGQEVVAAWETAQQIYSAAIDPRTGSVSGLAAAPGEGSRKHPSIAVNASGDRLLAWTEGTAWKRGGTFAWRLTSRAGAQLASAADAGPVPVWGLVSAVAMPDGSFVIIR
jgi:hypothetical protein